MKQFTKKRSGLEIGMRTFEGTSGITYLVFKERNRIVFHVLAEVEAKEAARDCGADTSKLGAAQIWDKLWKESN